MKRIILSLLLAVITATAFAQVGTITVTVENSEPLTGLTSINYEFTGTEGRTYNITAEVNFDNTGYMSIAEDHLSGDLTGVGGTGTAFSGTIVWNGAAGFPDRYHDQTKVRVMAELVLAEDEVVDIDGNIYPTMIIGNQEWMAENLRVTRYKEGDAILADSDVDWDSTSDGAYAVYPHADIVGFDSDEEVLEAYGALYNWHAVDDTRGLCPAGWSVPSREDWTRLVDVLVPAQGFPNSNVAGGAGNALKSCLQEDSTQGGDCDTSTHPRWDSNDTHQGFDEFGFSALPGGQLPNAGNFRWIGSWGSWWSATESGTNLAWSYNLIRSYGDVDETNVWGKVYGLSVRCVRDIDE